MKLLEARTFRLKTIRLLGSGTESNDERRESRAGKGEKSVGVRWESKLELGSIYSGNMRKPSLCAQAARF